MDKDLKSLEWVGDSLKNLKQFPKEVQKNIGDALYDVQIGKTPPSAKPLKGMGSGVFEIIKRYDTDTYRAVYVVRIANTVYVLHAFQKKSKSGIKTPQKDIELIERRLKQVKEDANK